MKNQQAQQPIAPAATAVPPGQTAAGPKGVPQPGGEIPPQPPLPSYEDLQSGDGASLD
jgi:hypothetical protein